MFAANSGQNYNNVIAHANNGTLDLTTNGSVRIGSTTGANTATPTLNTLYANFSTDSYFTGKLGVGTASPNSTLHVNGSFATAYVAKTANYTLGASDYTVNFTSNADTATLPTAVGITGRIYVVVNSGVTVFIQTTSSQQFVNVIATPTTLLLNSLGASTFQSTGAGWMKLN